MAVTHGIKKYYSSFLGLNEIVDDISREAGFATDADNVRLLDDGAVAKRRGYKIFADNEGGYGVAGFDQIDPVTGSIVPEILVISDSLCRLRTAELTITNANTSGQEVIISLVGDGSTDEAVGGWGASSWGEFGWGEPAGRGFNLAVEVAQLVDDDGNELIPTETTEYYLGDQVENTGLAIGPLTTSLNSNANLTATSTIEITTPAPFLELLDDLTLAYGESVDITYYYTEEVTADSAAGFANGFAAFKTDLDAAHIDHAVFNKSVYFATGSDPLQQYDGHALFRAGMEQGTLPTSSSSGAGSITGDYIYAVQPWFRDYNGQYHYGALSDPSTVLTLSSNTADVVLTNIQDANGFDARGAYAAGAQSNSPASGLVTLTVDNGSGAAHTVVAGDTVRLFNSDGATNAYAEYPVVSVTGTTIVVTSAVDIDLTDNLVISTGLFLDLYRTKDGGSSYFLVEQLNNDPFSATQTFTDTIVDNNLLARYIEPLQPLGEPPQTKYVTSYNNSLVLGNSKVDPNKVFYSEADAPTNFPILNNFLTESNDGGVITALTQSNENLVVFRDRSIFLIAGDFESDRVTVTNLSSGGVGCVSHKSIIDINGILLFLGDRGVYTMAGAGVPQLASDPVIKSITSNRTEVDKKLRYKRAVAVHHIQDKQYILYIPAESVDSGNRYANDDSLCVVYNYVRDSWTKWDSMNFSSGVTYINDELWFSSREKRDSDTEVNYRVWRQHNKNSLLDYGDQLDPISFRYASGWESVENPSVAKKFLRVKLHSYSGQDSTLPTSAFTVDASTEIDYKPDSPHSSFSFVFPERGATWDSELWDTVPWGGAQQPTYKTKLRKGQARSLRLILENSEYNTNAIFTGFELEYAAPQGNTIKQ